MCSRKYLVCLLHGKDKNNYFLRVDKGVYPNISHPKQGTLKNMEAME